MAISGETVVGTYDVECPECHETVPITVRCWQNDAELTHEGQATLACEPDMADLWAHVWLHEEVS